MLPMRLKPRLMNVPERSGPAGAELRAMMVLRYADRSSILIKNAAAGGRCSRRVSGDGAVFQNQHAIIVDAGALALRA